MCTKEELEAAYYANVRDSVFMLMAGVLLFCTPWLNEKCWADRWWFRVPGLIALRLAYGCVTDVLVSRRRLKRARRHTNGQE